MNTSSKTAPTTTPNPIFKFDVAATADVVDGNGHVNNVVYIQWMQDAAIRHAQTTGCSQASLALGTTWVVRTHQVEYFSPAFAGDKITVLTWVSNLRKVRSLRKYKFLRVADQTLLARAETDWVLVNAKTGRPQSIPDDIKSTLPVVRTEMEP
jgi:acyl-CoA thioester hydrolase